MSEPAWLAGKRAAALATYDGAARCRPTARRRGGSRTCAASIRTCSPPIRGRSSSRATRRRRRRSGASRARSTEQPGAASSAHLGSVVSDGEKFAAGKRRPLARRRVPARAGRRRRSTAPLRAAVELTEEGSALYHRVLVVLERGARATFIEEFRSSAPGYLNVVVELDGRRRSPARVRHACSTTTPRRASSARTGPPSAATPSSTGCGGARRHARQVAHGELAGRPRRTRQGHRRLLPDRPRARRLRHDPGARRARTRPPTSRSRACWPTAPERCGAASSASTRARRRPTPIRRTATCCSRPTRRRRRSPASRSRPTTCAAPTARRSARWTAPSSST